MVISKIQVSDPGPSWPSCFFSELKCRDWMIIVKNFFCHCRNIRPVERYRRSSASSIILLNFSKQHYFGLDKSKVVGDDKSDSDTENCLWTDYRCMSLKGVISATKWPPSNELRKAESENSKDFFFFLAPLAIGQRAYVVVCCPSCVRSSVCALTFSLNIFSETTYRILMKFYRNVPAMVLFRISWKNLIPSKTVVAMATKLKKFWNLWKSSCQKP